MIEIQFYYKEKKTTIRCNKVEYTKEVFQKFSSEAKLNFDNLLFIYEGEKINLDADLKVGVQFNLFEKPRKKVKILVFDDIPKDIYYINFIYNQKEETIKSSKNEKINTIYQKFVSKAGVDISEIYLLYNGGVINQNNLEKTVNEFANNDDKQRKRMDLLVKNVVSRNPSMASINENNSINNQNAHLSDNLIDIINNENHENPAPEINQIDIDTKKYYLKLFFILLIQYGLITFLVWLGFFLNINEIFIKNNNTMMWTFLPPIIVLFIMSIIDNTLLENYKKEKFLFIYHIFYGLFIIFNCFLLSKYIYKKYILCSLFLIILEITAMEIFAFIFKTYKLYLFGISSFIFGLMSTVGFYFWIKDIITISIIYGIGFSFIFYLLLVIFFSRKVCELDEYIYASIIQDYSFFLAITNGSIKVFSCICRSLSNLQGYYDSNIVFYIKVFFYLLAEFILIISIVWGGFYLEFNTYLNSKKGVCISIFAIFLVILFAASITIFAFLCHNTESDRKDPGLYVFHCIYILTIIIYSFLLSKFIEQKIILGLLFIHLIHLIALEIYGLLFKSDNLLGIFFFLLIISTIAIILFSLFWINNRTAIIWISIIAFLNIIYLTIMSFISRENCNYNDYNFAVAIFNYCIFIAIFILTIGLPIGLIAAIFTLFHYLLCSKSS